MGPDGSIIFLVFSIFSYGCFFLKKKSGKISPNAQKRQKKQLNKKNWYTPQI